MMFREKMDHVRHPQSSDAGKAAYPQLSFYLVVDVKGGLAQFILLVYHFLNVGDQPCTVVR